MKVLITGNFTPGALFAIRRFGGLGFSITAADCHKMAFAMYSKYVKKRITVPRLREDPFGYAEGIIKELEDEKYDFFYPSFEEIILLSMFKDPILAATNSIIPDYNVLMTLHDKRRLHELGNAVGVVSPEIFSPADENELEEIVSKIDYPVAVKMKQSSAAAGLRLVETPDKIMDAFHKVAKTNSLKGEHLPFIQRWIEGPTICTTELCHKGEVLGEVIFKPIRMMPRNGGTSTFRESVHIPVISHAVKKLVKKLNFTGFLGFDFVLDKKRQIPCLVDGNPRSTVALNLAYHSGCDMIPQWVNIAGSQACGKLPACTPGVKTKTFFGDSLWLLSSYFSGLKTRSAEKESRKKYWSEKQFFYDILGAKDNMPTAMLYLFNFTNLYKLIFGNYDPGQLFCFHNQFSQEMLPESYQDCNGRKKY